MYAVSHLLKHIKLQHVVVPLGSPHYVRIKLQHVVVPLGLPHYVGSQSLVEAHQTSTRSSSVRVTSLCTHQTSTRSSSVRVTSLCRQSVTC